MKAQLDDQYPLSSLQQGMLFHYLLAPGLGTDIEQMVCTLLEDLAPVPLRKAWERVVDRHAILRTAFLWENREEPAQAVSPQVTVPWSEIDWRGVPESQQTERLEAFLVEDRLRGFKMSEAPLLRLTLFRLGAEEYRLVWTFHHVLLDGRSFPLVLREVFAFYEASKTGVDLALPLPRRYRDYIEWLQTQDFSKTETFWRQQLKGFTVPTPLPADRLSSSYTAGNGRQGDQRSFLSEAVTKALNRLTSDAQVTLNTLVQGAWSILLSRYSGEEDVVFGATRACRKSTIQGAESMVGLFINTLPLRVRVLPEAPLVPWLQELRAQWMEMRDYEHTPLVNIQGWSDAPRGKPLFESILVFENSLLDSALRLQSGAWAKRHFRLYEQTNYPLTLGAYSGDRICLQLEFDRTRFDDRTVGSILNHLKTLMEGMVAHYGLPDGSASTPDPKLMDLPLMTPDERRQLLVEWNDTLTDYPGDTRVHQLFEAQVNRAPEAIAVVSGDRHLTYEELNRRANRLAHHLRGCGVGPDVPVALGVERSPEMVIGLLGILKAGGAYVPLDLAYPAERIAFMLADARVPVVVTQRESLKRLPQHSARVVCLEDLSEALPVTNPSDEGRLGKPDDLCYIIYTSGSTGQPKGVEIPHRAVVNFLTSMRRAPGLSSGDVVLAVTTLSFDIAALEIFLPLTTGASVVVVSRDVARDPRELSKELAQHGVTVAQATPVTWRMLIESEWGGDKRLKVLCGGESITRDLADKLLEQCGEVWNMYGPTETTIWSTIRQLGRGEPVTIGRPVANTRVYIVNSCLQPVPVGVVGELLIGGAGVARGYRNRPELTAEKFISDPFIADGQSRVYRTGDMARYLPNSEIDCLGRKDSQVKINGFRIELGEIEAVLAGHPSVRNCAVVVREDGAGDKRLAGYVVAREGQVCTVDVVGDWLRDRLPDHMVPSSFVVLDRLPLTPNGKVDRRALPQIGGLPPASAIEGAVLDNDAERKIAKVWQEVLAITRVGRDSNFFDLGGDSLRMIRVRSRLEEAFDRKISVVDLFRHTTVRMLAEFISGRIVQSVKLSGSREDVEARRINARSRLKLRQQARV